MTIKPADQADQKKRTKVPDTLLEDDSFRRLVFGVFELNVEGKKLLQKLHELYIDSVAFPAIPAQLTQFGSPEIYAGFKSGQANVIKFLEFQIKQIKDGN